MDDGVILDFCAAMRRGRPNRLDPKLEAKILDLYLAPPTNAVTFCVDWKIAIRALDRPDPLLPMSRGRAERHGFEYKRNGTRSHYAALNVKTGSEEGMTAGHLGRKLMRHIRLPNESCQLIRWAYSDRAHRIRVT